MTKKEICDVAGYAGPDRRQCPYLDETAIEEIATRAADLAVEKMTQSAYQAVGRSVVEKFMWLVGLCVTGLVVWAVGKGYIKL